MGFVTEIFQKIANALVMSTEFPKQISDMKADLASLHTDLETTKGRNAELDALLHDTRRQRDEAEQALSQVKNELAVGQKAMDDMSHSLNQATDNVAMLQMELTSVRKDRDDYGMKQMEAEERAKLAEAKLAKLAEALGLPKAEEPKPSFQSSSPTPVPSLPETVQLQAEVKPEPTPPKRVYQGEEAFSNLSYITEKWDSDKLDWYRTA